MTITLLPDITAAYLPSAGLQGRRATLHVWDHSKEHTIHTPERKITGIAHWFRCTETGTIRVWGFVG